MRVLIVNAYHDTPQGLKSFNSFYNAIHKAFSVQKHFNKEDMKLTAVDRNTIDEYLYEQNTAFMDPQASKKFDYLDFIFIDGEPNMLPWYPQCQKFLILLRMVKRTQKILFAAGCGMLIQIYLCANKYHVNKVINGKGKGTSLKKIHEITAEELGHIQAGQVFLDSGTGDMYCYDNQISEFYPVVNVGFHHHKIAEDMENKQSILKSFKYQPRNFEFFQPVNAGKRSEVVCRVLKQFVQHWLVKDIGLQDFLVSQKNSWDVHAVNVVDLNSRFTILADSPRSPQIIIQHNTAATLFNVNPTYPESVKVLNNFIEHMLKELEYKNKLDIPLSSVPYSVLPCRPVVSPAITSSRPITASTAKLDTSVYPGQPTLLKSQLRPSSSHSGFTISKRKHEAIILQNNATRQIPIQVQPPKPATESETMYLPLGSASNLRIKGTFDKTSVFLLRQQLGFGSTSIAENIDRGTSGFSENSSNFLQDKNHPNELIRLVNSQECIEEDNEAAPWNKNEIRAMLHGSEYKSGEHVGKKQKIKIVHRKLFNRKWKEGKGAMTSTLNHKSKTLKYPFPGSINSVSPYVEPAKAKIREEARPGEWSSADRFLLTCKKTGDDEIQKINYNGPYNPPNAHKFREEDKTKWIQGLFRVV